MPSTTTHLDPAEAWALASRERVMSLSMVGDAFGRPMLDELESGNYDLSGLFVIVTGGAALSAPVKQRFVELLPHLTILDAGGSSESGAQMIQASNRMQSASGRFAPEPRRRGGQRGHDPDPVAGRRRDGLAGPAGPDSVGLLGRCGEDRADFPGHRRGPALGSR